MLLTGLVHVVQIDDFKTPEVILRFRAGNKPHFGKVREISNDVALSNP